MPRHPRKEKRVRLNLEPTQAFKDRLERLRVAMDAESMSEVIRRSFYVFETLYEHVKGGGMVILRNADKSCDNEVIIT